MVNTIKMTALGSVLLFTLALSPVAVSAEEGTIVDVAIATPQLSSLVDAVVAQDLVDPLSGSGPLTVFAPVNEAFEKIPPFIGRAIERNPEVLTQILLYHVASGDLKAADVIAERRIETLQGGKLLVRTSGDEVFINRAKVVIPNVEASNGTVHVIDKVMVPMDVAREAFREELKELRMQLQKIRDQLRSFR